MIKNKEFIDQACKSLKKISPNPFIESQWILSNVLKKSVLDIHEKHITETEKELFFQKVKQRKQGWPLSYVLKEAYFFDSSFYVDHGVFIPRPESKLIVQEALKLNIPFIKGVDFGSGSGSLAITLLNKKSKSEFLALEISSPSLKCLRVNRDRFNLQNRLHILNQSVSFVTYQNTIWFLKSRPNLIVANPPYIKSGDQHLHSNVRRFEPPLALFSPEEGLFCIRSWFYKAMELLEDRGVYIFEFGYDQGERVADFLSASSLKYKIIEDDQNIKRVAICWKPKS